MPEGKEIGDWGLGIADCGLRIEEGIEHGAWSIERKRERRDLCGLQVLTYNK